MNKLITYCVIAGTGLTLLLGMSSCGSNTETEMYDENPTPDEFDLEAIEMEDQAKSDSVKAHWENKVNKIDNLE